MLSLKNISKSYDDFKVQDVNLKIEPGEIIVMVGESGSGKSTLLRMIAGLESIDQGLIEFDGKDWTNVNSQKRNIGFVFQDYALFPHLNVKDNVLFGVKSKSDLLLNELLELVGLSGYANKMIHEISGGEQQRVALARSLATQPNLMLLDEPFSNLDTMLKQSVRKEVKRILKANQTTSIIVTHDLEDAYELADRIAVMKDGELVQFDKPEQMYKNPVNGYVAGLTGTFSMYDDKLIRSEDIIVKEDGDLKGKVTASVYKGDHYELRLDVEGQTLMLKLSKDSVKNEGDYINFSFK
jgi:iron(III) transport system ATP-binding protein